MTKNIVFQRFLIVFILLIFFVNNLVNAQSLKELEKKKKGNKKEINYINKLLKSTQKDTKKSYNKFLILNKKINARCDLISNINEEKKIIDTKIEDHKRVISSLESDLKQLRDEYAKMIYYAYKNRNSYHRLMFIFSSKDFNQAYKRLKYLQQYSEYRRKQAEVIMQTKQILTNKLAEFDTKKAEKQKLLNEKKQESVVLAFEKAEQCDVLNHLKTKEKDLKKKLAQQQLIANKLQKAIEEIIAEEAKKAAEKGTKIFELTPEDKLISSNFGRNRGRLPWPTEKALITGNFGVHPHAVLPGIEVQNNGIDLATTEGAIVRSLFTGVVRKVIAIQGANKAVIIRHGNYLTVYQNLIKVFVKAGDKVNTKQSIGVVFTDKYEDNKTTLHLEIWRETTKLDPVLWLCRK